jgi:hypothetical protein
MLTLHGQPYVFGGINTDHIILNTVYTSESNAWNTRAHMMTALAGHGAVVFDADTALVYAHSVRMDCGWY